MDKINEQNLILEVPFQISSAETDLFARIKLGAFVNLLIQSAIQSADMLGAGYSDIGEQKLFWVFSRLSAEIYRPLRWYEKVSVETWPKDLDKILYLRDFIVRDANRKEVCRATSAWLAIDAHTKRPKKVEGIRSEIFSALKSKQALSKPPEKLLQVEGSLVSEIQPTYFDFDLNGHVTATRYVDWMMDSLPIPFHQHHFPKRLAINYLKETLPNDHLRLFKKMEGTCFNFEGKKMDETPVFRGEIQF